MSDSTLCALVLVKMNTESIRDFAITNEVSPSLRQRTLLTTLNFFTSTMIMTSTNEIPTPYARSHWAQQLKPLSNDLVCLFEIYI